MFSNPVEFPDNLAVSPASELHSTTFISNPQESDAAISWGSDPFQDIFQFPDNVPVQIQNDNVEHSASYVSAGNAKPDDFRELVDQLMSDSVDDPLNLNWNDLLAVSDDVAEPISKV